MFLMLWVQGSLADHWHALPASIILTVPRIPVAWNATLGITASAGMGVFNALPGSTALIAQRPHAQHVQLANSRTRLRPNARAVSLENTAPLMAAGRVRRVPPDSTR